MVILTVQLPKPDRHTDLASEKNIVWVATIRIQCGLPGSKKDFQPHADGHVEYAKCRAHHQQHNCSSATANMLSSMVITNVFIPLVVGLGTHPIPTCHHTVSLPKVHVELCCQSEISRLDKVRARHPVRIYSSLCSSHFTRSTPFTLSGSDSWSLSLRIWTRCRSSSHWRWGAVTVAKVLGSCGYA